MGADLGSRDEDRFFVAVQVDLPDGKVEIMDGQQ